MWLKNCLEEKNPSSVVVVWVEGSCKITLLDNASSNIITGNNGPGVNLDDLSSEGLRGDGPELAAGLPLACRWTNFLRNIL